jgi:hypothetical protein
MKLLMLSETQLSTVLHFVQEGKIHERFIGFTDVSADRTSDVMFSHVVNIVQVFHIVDILVGQTYN